MARPSSSLRLADLDPAQVAEQVVGLATTHTQRVAMRLGLELRPAGPCDLEWDVQLLVRYAQGGLAAVDWEDHADALDALGTLAMVLVDSPTSHHELDGLWQESGSQQGPQEPWRLAMLGAWARVKMSGSKRVSPLELAALAGVTPHYVRAQCRQGEIRHDKHSIRASEARRWLSGRGVAV